MEVSKKGEETVKTENKDVATDEAMIVSVLPDSVTAETINEQNRQYWTAPQTAGEDFENE